MKTVIYARKSRGTEEELSSQVSMCKDYCDKNNYDIAEIFSEIRSSQDFERKQYTALKNYVKENTKVRIIVTHADRLNRNLVEQAKLNELLLKTSSYIEVVGSGIIKLDTPENQMMSNIINSFNEYNYKLIRHKMVTGLHNFQERGGKVGATPIGFVKTDKYTYSLDPDKADTIRQIFKDIADGLTTKEVVNKLQKINFKTNTGKSLGTREVRNIIKNERYWNNNPQIVSRELWLDANSKLRSIPNNGNKRTYPLSNKIICSHCGTSLIIGYKVDRKCSVINSCNTSNSSRNGNYAPCTCQGNRLDIVENLVLSDVAAYLEIQLAKMYEQLKSNADIIQEHKQELDQITNDIEANSKKLQKLNDLYLMDNITADQLKEQSSSIKDTIAMLTLKKERVEGYSLYDKVTQLQDEIVKLEELQSNLTIEDATKLIDHVSYYKDESGLQVNTVFK